MTLKYYKMFRHVWAGDAELKTITEPACHREVNMQWVCVLILSTFALPSADGISSLQCVLYSSMTFKLR
jgi:hypothetical protein